MTTLHFLSLELSSILRTEVWKIFLWKFLISSSWNCGRRRTLRYCFPPQLFIQWKIFLGRKFDEISLKFFQSYTCDPTVHVECIMACNTSSQCRFGGTCVNGSCSGIYRTIYLPYPSDHVLMLVLAEYSVTSDPYEFFFSTFMYLVTSPIPPKWKDSFKYHNQELITKLDGLSLGLTGISTCLLEMEEVMED